MAKTYTTQDVLVDVNALKEYKSKSDEALEQKIQEVQGDVTSKGESLSSLQETVQSQGSSIATNTSNIQKNTEALEKKVDKVEGSTLITTAKLALIDTNAANISSQGEDINSLKTGKVDKVEGSSLITAAQLAQIETNKSTLETVQAAVSTLQTQNEGIDSFLEEYV